ncbi:MAG: hypothetical protein N2256_01240 [Tepidimonas ignava]|uniref:HEPN AbiU2-like domain-containing protein n=1 Tax=Tepidimonas ignava TaxID=114249 RepID=A0A4R3LFV8_9BURK|nr:hypothetical protein [Tepidimonas ignava]MCX7814102.1 hypothetical protein [Tepidimonas ignava]TCS98983.1 hypothetical protein EDC36_10339 [Tepidimonas ignava]TSE22934.1 hypothetical protein Tigna_00916 [Tepidimonas ignava]
MTSLQDLKAYLGDLLTAIQRSVYFLVAADQQLPWPLSGAELAARKKDEALYQTLSAFNERYAKLQDTVGAAMRHASLLLGERTDDFLHVLAHFEKAGVITSVETWQALRLARNQAAHEYETDYGSIAEHFNALHALLPELVLTAARLVALSQTKLGIGPRDDAFASDVQRIVERLSRSP